MKNKEREVEGDTSRERIGEVVLKIDITDSDGEEDSEETAGDSIQPGDTVVHRSVPDGTEKPDSESGTSGKQENCTYYVQVKEKVNITQKKKHQLETIIKCVLQSRPEDITVQEVSRLECKALLPVSLVVHKYIARHWGMLRECTLGSYRVLRFYQHKYN